MANPMIRRDAMNIFRRPSYDDLLTVGAFIAYHDDHHMSGGFTAAEALAAFCRIMGFDVEKFRPLIRGEEAETP